MRRLALLLACLATSAIAEAPTRSPIPAARPGPFVENAAPVVADPSGALVVPTIRPPSRPETFVPAAPQVIQKTAAESLSALAVFRSPTPPPRPDNLLRRTVVRQSGMAQSGDHARAVTARGSVCGIASIKGNKLQPIPGRIKGCGVAEPVSVTSVAGVSLSTPAVVDCDTAKALHSWVEDSVAPRVGRLGGGVSGLYVMASYACRTRNNQPGAKVSEHGRGHAVDIGAIVLENGVALTVLDDWSGQHGKLMKSLHADACGTFGTVLGPNADSYHRNHFHLDTARYRSGSYCR